MPNNNDKKSRPAPLRFPEVLDVQMPNCTGSATPPTLQSAGLEADCSSHFGDLRICRIFFISSAAL
jgi:hypothetical protein